jgi:murein DD-endopeptidase MepM/ murein hydrolase activator NlpD
MPIGKALLSALLATVTATGATGASVSTPHEHEPPPAVASASAPGSAPGSAPTPDGVWGWPLEPVPEVERRFDPPDQPWLPGHRGVDLASHVGQSVLAPTDGTVTWNGVIAGRSVVVVRHRDGLRSTFEPVTGAPTGTSVRRGEPVGVVTAVSGHCAPKTCLHWGVLRGATYLDPLSFVGRPPIVLLPLS